MSRVLADRYMPFKNVPDDPVSVAKLAKQTVSLTVLDLMHVSNLLGLARAMTRLAETIKIAPDAPDGKRDMIEEEIQTLITETNRAIEKVGRACGNASEENAMKELDTLMADPNIPIEIKKMAMGTMGRALKQQQETNEYLKRRRSDFTGTN